MKIFWDFCIGNEQFNLAARWSHESIRRFFSLTIAAPHGTYTYTHARAQPIYRRVSLFLPLAAFSPPLNSGYLRFHMINWPPHGCIKASSCKSRTGNAYACLSSNAMWSNDMSRSHLWNTVGYVLLGLHKLIDQRTLRPGSRTVFRFWTAFRSSFQLPVSPVELVIGFPVCFLQADQLIALPNRNS